MGSGDQSGKKTCDPKGCEGAGRLMKPFWGETIAIEIHPGKSIHLRIKEPWAEIEVAAPKVTSRPFLVAFDMDDRLSFDDETHRINSSWYFTLNDHPNSKSSIRTQSR
jgi:hypothetical protein